MSSRMISVVFVSAGIYNGVLGVVFLLPGDKPKDRHGDYEHARCTDTQDTHTAANSDVCVPRFHRGLNELVLERRKLFRRLIAEASDPVEFGRPQQGVRGRFPSLRRMPKCTSQPPETSVLLTGRPISLTFFRVSSHASSDSISTVTAPAPRAMSPQRIIFAISKPSAVCAIS